MATPAAGSAVDAGAGAGSSSNSSVSVSGSGSSSGDVSVTHDAWAMVVMHAAAHPAAAVSGLLLGHSDGKLLSITDAAPLFHHGTTTPMLELATNMVQKYCAKQSRLSIVGYYFGNIKADDTSVGTLPAQVVATISKTGSNGRAVLAQIHATALASNPLQCLKLCKRHPSSSSEAGKWSMTSTAIVPLAGSSARAAKVLGHKQASTVVDFDDHFDDVSKDWTNKHIASLVASS